MYELGNSRVRQDIQQLRGIAVIAVVLNHLNITGFSQGFLGVDVFFVVSGFVITSSLLASTPKGSSRRQFFLTFWTRRIFRLWPMLMVTVVSTSVLVSAVGLAPPSTLLTGASSLLGVSNFRLLLGRLDYFALNTASDWFMHTWSLAVEEQVYLLLSLIFAFVCGGTAHSLTRRRQRTLVIVIGVLSASSAFAAVATASNELIRFYSPHTRFFQIGIGSLLALTATSLTEKRERLSMRLRQRLAYASLVVMLCQFSVGPTSPVTSSVIISVTTVALLGFASKSQHDSGYLSVRWLGDIGDKSYAIYLVHWPVQLLWATIVSDRWLLIAGSLVTTMIVGSLGYRWVENPTRRYWMRLDSRKTLLLPVTGLVLALGISLGSFTILERETRATDDAASRPTCDDNAARVWVIGDSHLYATPVESIIFDRVNGQCGSLGGYGLVLTFDDIGWSTDGSRRLRAQLPNIDFVEKQILLREQPPQAVVITHFLTGYLSDQKMSPPSAASSFVVTEWQGDDGQLISREEFLRRFSRNLARVAQVLDEFGGSLIVTSPPPDFDWFNGSGSNIVCRSRFVVSRECSMLATPATITLQQHEARGAEIRRLLDDLQRTQPNFVHLRLDTPFCDGDGCSNFADGTALYMDDDHINSAGGRLVRPLVDEALDRVLPEGPTELACPRGGSVFACRIAVRGGLTDRYSRPATFVARSSSARLAQLRHTDDAGNTYCLTLTTSDEVTFVAGDCGS